MLMRPKLHSFKVKLKITTVQMKLKRKLHMRNAEGPLPAMHREDITDSMSLKIILPTASSPP